MVNCDIEGGKGGFLLSPLTARHLINTAPYPARRGFPQDFASPFASSVLVWLVLTCGVVLRCVPLCSSMCDH